LWKKIRWFRIFKTFFPFIQFLSTQNSSSKFKNKILKKVLQQVKRMEKIKRLLEAKLLCLQHSSFSAISSVIFLEIFAIILTKFSSISYILSFSINVFFLHHFIFCLPTCMVMLLLWEFLGNFLSSFYDWIC